MNTLTDDSVMHDTSPAKDSVSALSRAQVGTIIPEKVLLWQFAGRSGGLRSQNSYSPDHDGNGYNMHCKANGQYLTYGKQNLGINLAFTGNMGEHKIHFRLPDGKERPILSGERVALGIGGGDAFLKYANRTVGINLEWSAKPVFEWLIYGPTGEKGKPLTTGIDLAVINTNVEPDADFLVQLDRVGADIGWTTSPDWKGKIIDWISHAAFKKLIEALK